MQKQQTTTVVWASQDNISSEFDVPYSPVIEQSVTQKFPDPGGFGQRLKHALLPEVLVSFLSTKSRQRSLWDRVVFVWFCGCLFLLSYVLAGFGYSGHDITTCTLFTSGPSYTIASALSDMTAPSASLLKGVIMMDNEAEGEKPDWEGDGCQPEDYHIATASFRISDASTVELPVFNSASTTTSLESPHEHTLKPHDAQAPMANLPTFHHFAHHANDPFDLEPFFDGGGYGNDGQPFALKIHIPQDMSSSHAVHHGENSRRCRGSGRC